MESREKAVVAAAAAVEAVVKRKRDENRQVDGRGVSGASEERERRYERRW